MIVGLLVGLSVYCATAFPAAAIFGFDGDIWAGVCMLWGVTCGGAGVLWGLGRG